MNEAGQSFWKEGVGIFAERATSTIPNKKDAADLDEDRAPGPGARAGPGGRIRIWAILRAMAHPRHLRLNVCGIRHLPVPELRQMRHLRGDSVRHRRTREVLLGQSASVVRRVGQDDALVVDLDVGMMIRFLGAWNEGRDEEHGL